ncbi:MAG: hypothetical protein IJV37_03535 [Bacteroidales bacterium]|nr:hypothetical protein [Bacteroidales bacterium]
MKKIFSILSAGVLVLMAASCVKEQLATFDPAKTTAPVLGTVEEGPKSVAVSYTPGSFNLGFNDKMTPTHSLALTSVDGKTVSKLISSKADGSVLTATKVNISKALAFFGYADGDVISSLDIVVRATLQNASQDNGRNGYVDSDKFTLSNFTVTLPQGSPYQEYTAASTWSVTGALSAYEINWDGDLEMFSTEDGNQLVAKAVRLNKDDKFKFRKDQDWTDNYGGVFGSLDSEFTAEAGGADIAVGAEGVYDLWLDLDAQTIIVTEAYLAYPDLKDASAWGVTGALPEHGINWDGDIPMITDGKTHVAQGVKLGADDKFKFRKDHDWTENYGGVFGGLDAEFAAEENGGDIAVGTAGVYDLILDTDGKTIRVVETLGGGVSGIIGGDEPEPEPAYTGWGIIGDFNEWGGDVAMTEEDGVWTGYFTNITKEDGSNGGFKLRKDAAWEESAGGTFSAPGTAFDAVTKDGPNIVVPAGFYKVVYDTNAQKITVSEGTVWSLIGDFNGWGGDVDMVETESGIWVSPATELNNKGFKIRKNHDWGTSYGGAFKALGEAFEATTTENNNIMLAEDGEYIVTFDSNKMTITVEAALPSNFWSVIGTVSGTNWNKDFYMTQFDAVWISEPLEFAGDSEFKLRFNNSWADEDCIGAPADGVTLVPGETVSASHPGKNLKVKDAGTYTVVYDSAAGTVYLMGWSLIGNVNETEWDMDFPMTIGSDGRWYSQSVLLGGEFKLRYNASWDDENTRGAAEDGFKFAPLTPFTVASPGKNLNVPEAGYYTVAFDAVKGEVTVYRSEWALIGNVNGTEWNRDFFLVEYSAGVYTSPVVTLNGEFKLRRNASWDDADTRGAAEDGFTLKSGEAFTVAAPGKNIKAGLAEYVVKYTPDSESVVAESVATTD